MEQPAGPLNASGSSSSAPKAPLASSKIGVQLSELSDVSGMMEGSDSNDGTIAQACQNAQEHLHSGLWKLRGKSCPMLDKRTLDTWHGDHAVAQGCSLAHSMVKTSGTKHADFFNFIGDQIELSIPIDLVSPAALICFPVAITLKLPMSDYAVKYVEKLIPRFQIDVYVAALLQLLKPKDNNLNLENSIKPIATARLNFDLVCQDLKPFSSNSANIHALLIIEAHAKYWKLSSNTLAQHMFSSSSVWIRRALTPECPMRMQINDKLEELELRKVASQAPTQKEMPHLEPMLKGHKKSFQFPTSKFKGFRESSRLRLWNGRSGAARRSSGFFDRNERATSTEDEGREFLLPRGAGDDDDRDQNNSEYAAHGPLGKHSTTAMSPERVRGMDG
ncbi:hypothetical protein DFJ58DRAFT_846934 [Suillus subalutaceus]|uniref:uncharacterized protein n=1 Tax=Suillus subalutaceus TaxID=48586 RepID=UPI001B861D99|nr:uncharacterized protein DFJ58DRAFT_846934 [Suillus subalutaceus]KAG1836518.1 hypothetical protein DFJ58DRAFT_846934 [Suillus subalutaceus]